MRLLTITILLVSLADVARTQGTRSGSQGAGDDASSELFLLGEHEGSLFGHGVVVLGDVDGDGLDDLLVSAPHFGRGSQGAWSEGEVYLYSSRKRWGVEPAWRVQAPYARGRFGHRIAAPDDVDGDGYADALISAVTASPDHRLEGVVQLYRGGPSGLQATPSWEVRGGGVDVLLGLDVQGAGDVNGDGFPDVVVVGGDDQVRVYHGGPTGLPAVPSTSIPNPIAGSSGWMSVSGVGDLDLDGYDDVVVVDSVVRIHKGSAAGLDPVPSQAFWEAGAQLTSVTPVGDTDGNGYPEFVRGYSNGGTWAYDLFGASPTGVAMQLNDIRTGGWVSEVEALGDVDADGYDDILVTPGGGLDPEIYWGSSSGIDYASRRTTIDTGRIPGNTWGMATSAVGHLNDDGIPDLVFGNPWFSKSGDPAGREDLHGAVFLSMSPGWCVGATRTSVRTR